MNAEFFLYAENLVRFFDRMNVFNKLIKFVIVDGAQCQQICSGLISENFRYKYFSHLQVANKIVYKKGWEFWLKVM